MNYKNDIQPFKNIGSPIVLHAQKMTNYLIL